MAPILSNILPRVLIVSRRTVRKNKFVDFVGEYHLDLLVSYGAAPVIVPRVNGVHTLLESFEPIHGVLLCEGEDIDPSLYNSETSEFSPEELEDIRRSHASDTAIDRERDSIEFKLVNLCLERNIPYLGICRGSQVLNVACGGTLYQDIERELNPRNDQAHVVHMDYENYDGHRHMIKVVKGTPLNHWFKDSMNSEMEISVNSYHHQGVRRLASRFVPMAFAPDGLIEGFYDPDAYCPEEGKFIMGLQFHPERMRSEESDEFDYPGCSFAYREFVKAVKAYGRKLNGPGSRRRIPRSFSFAKIVYSVGTQILVKESGLEAGAEFLQENAVLSLQQEKRLKQMGATVRNSSVYMQKVKMNEDRDNVARAIIQKMSTEKLTELVSFYQKMGQICSEALEIQLKTPLV